MMVDALHHVVHQADTVHEDEQPPVSYKQFVRVARATFAAVESLRSFQPIRII